MPLEQSRTRWLILNFVGEVRCTFISSSWSDYKQLTPHISTIPGESVVRIHPRTLLDCKWPLFSFPSQTKMNLCNVVTEVTLILSLWSNITTLSCFVPSGNSPAAEAVVQTHPKTFSWKVSFVYLGQQTGMSKMKGMTEISWLEDIDCSSFLSQLQKHILIVLEVHPSYTVSSYRLMVHKVTCAN
jgi:hypothetical protein